MSALLEKRNYKDIDESLIEKISNELNLDKKLIELLVVRGLKDSFSINNFLNPSIDNLYDPYLMKNMDLAHDRIQQAINNREKIVICGDYDVDGVCSAAILALFFSSKGLNSGVHIPNRYIDGYGLNISSLDVIIENDNPDLIITCDCGISCHDEIEYINDLGIDTIVTDHHEPGLVIPNGIVINPKQNGDNYPDKMLCGTGVVFKLIQSFCSKEEYSDYLDLVCIATIADLVPLLNENRLLVQLGLNKINSLNYNKGLKSIIQKYCMDDIVTSSDLAYKICPKINAAGRIGDAYRAFELLILTDDKRINDIIEEIDTDNNKRKELCDKIIYDSNIILKNQSLLNSRSIILVHDNWEKGVTGIAAAKFSSEFHRPTFIIVDKDEKGIYKGTARGIDGVNIYNSLNSVSDLLLEFGGHSGAAGFSIHESNLSAFKTRINDYFNQLDESLFLNKIEYDLDVSIDELNEHLYNLVDYLEPTGQNNKKPLFNIIINNPRVSPCKNSSHTLINFANCSVFAFNNIKKNQFLLGNDDKNIIFELSGIRGKNLSGIAKSVIPSSLYVNKAYARAVFLYDILFYGLLYLNKECNYLKFDNNYLKEIIGNNHFGTLVICGCEEDANDAYDIANKELFECCFLNSPEVNNYSTLVVSPILEDFSLINYDKIIFNCAVTKSFLCYINKIAPNAKIYVNTNKSLKSYLDNISFDRNVFSRYFKFIKSYSNLISKNIAQTLRYLNPLMQGDLCFEQFVVCFCVFYDLGFIYFENDSILFDSSVKASLESSYLYNMLVNYNG